jgi:uncharacterized protein YjiS (DUF1127 family)
MATIPLHSCDELPGARPRQAALEALGDAAHWVMATLREWRRRISEREQLAMLDDRMLRDIGLTRGDAEFLINKPFWRQ